MDKIYTDSELACWGTQELIAHILNLQSRDDIKRGANKSIRIPISTNDAEELRDGAVFEWSFPVEGSASSEWIDVELVGTDEEEL